VTVVCLKVNLCQIIKKPIQHVH